METESPFCPECLAASQSGSPGKLSTIQGIGRMFHGRTQTCERCGSSVRTAWSVFLLLPLVPRGSFRVVEFDELAAQGVSSTPFFARRVSLCWPQVLRTWAVGGLALLFLAWIVVQRFS
ncbi:MAG: hypothetical protein IT454_22205 [Planctomycetes bacterium]|nr:hypothetical protein [Planctomycetota bacterium]